MPTQLCRNILIVRMGALGDILHALPAQQQLSHQLPEASIHWVSEAAYVPLLQTVPGISRIWPANTKKWRRQPFQPGEMVSLFRDLRRQRFDLALDFQGLLKSAVLARISGASRILGFVPERFKEKGIQWFYTKSQVGEGDLTRHIIETNLDLIRELVPVSKAQPVIPFSIPESDRDYVQRKLEELEIANPVLINPGAGWVTKLWPVRNYARLALEIQRQLGTPVVVTYGPGEEHLVEQIQNELAPGRLAAFPTSIVQLASLCQSSRLMIAEIRAHCTWLSRPGRPQSRSWAPPLRAATAHSILPMKWSRETSPVLIHTSVPSTSLCAWTYLLRWCWKRSRKGWLNRFENEISHEHPKASRSHRLRFRRRVCVSLDSFSRLAHPWCRRSGYRTGVENLGDKEHLEEFVQFATSGPYRWTRNPLYLGFLILGSGFMIASAQPILLIAFAVLFFGVYVPVMRKRGKGASICLRAGL